MNDYHPSPLDRSGVDIQASAPGEVSHNRVLRNTYWLLALSMVPTVLGAALALSLGLNQVMAGRPGMTAILFLAGAFVLMFAIERNKNSSLGVALLLVFTFFMGIMLSQLLGFVLRGSNGAQLIMTAFGGTAVVFAAMASLAGTVKRDLSSSLGKWLFTGLMVIVAVSLVNVFFLHMPALVLTVSVLAIVIFSAFMLVDLQRIINGGETNYVSATLAVYLDVYNVFSNLLMILSMLSGNNRN